MGQNVAQKLIGSHLADGEMTARSEIGLRIDQTLTQDATGTMVMLELEALGLDRVRTQASVQYADHNLLQADERNMADHLFLRSACHRFGVWYSRPGSGVSHPVHMQRFGRPGASLAGSDSQHGQGGSLVQVQGLRWPDEIGSGRRGCRTCELYRLWLRTQAWVRSRR
jgi:aconitate hydratase